MNSLVKSCSLAVILSLALSTTARAAQLDRTVASDKPVSQSLLIAQKNQPVDLGVSSAQFFNEMIMLHMRIADSAQRMLNQAPEMQAQNPEMRRMALEMMNYSNAQILKLTEERQKMFRVYGR